MRKILLPLLFIWCHVLTAQDDIFDPQYFWTEVSIDWLSSHTTSYKYDPTPVEQNGKEYYEILSSENENGGDWQRTGILMRNEGTKLYRWLGEDRLLIDFNLTIGDTIYSLFGSPLTIVTVDSVALQTGEKKKRLGITCDLGGQPGVPLFYWIEGIGSTAGMAHYEIACVTDIYAVMLCLHHDGTLLFDHEDYDTCWIEYVSTEDLEKNGISFYPNPVSQTLSINDPNHKVLKVWITDLSGKVLLSTTHEKINTSMLSPGTYMLSFELTTGKRVSEKIIRM